MDLQALMARTLDRLGYELVDLERAGRGLVRLFIDNGAIDTGANYGFTLYRSPTTGKFFGFTAARREGHPPRPCTGRARR